MNKPGFWADYDMKIVCNELRRQGLLSVADWACDASYCARRFDSTTYLGYRLWASPCLRMMQRHRPLARALAIPVRWMIADMRYQHGARSNRHFLGLLINRGLFWPANRLIGKTARFLGSPGAKGFSPSSKKSFGGNLAECFVQPPLKGDLSMKKSIFSALTVAGLVASVGTASATPNSGTVNFQGYITESACSISGGDTNMTVPMGSITKNEFTTAGTRNTTPARFSISLLNCNTEVAKNATIAFTGNVVGTGLLALEPSGAQGVAVALFNANNQAITVGGTGVSGALTNGTNEFKFQAYYQATTAVANIVAGAANAKATFTVTYS